MRHVKRATTGSSAMHASERRVTVAVFIRGPVCVTVLVRAGVLLLSYCRISPLPVPFPPIGGMWAPSRDSVRSDSRNPDLIGRVHPNATVSGISWADTAVTGHFHCSRGQAEPDSEPDSEAGTPWLRVAHWHEPVS